MLTYVYVEVFETNKQKERILPASTSLLTGTEKYIYTLELTALADALKLTKNTTLIVIDKTAIPMVRIENQQEKQNFRMVIEKIDKMYVEWSWNCC